MRQKPRQLCRASDSPGRQAFFLRIRILAERDAIVDSSSQNHDLMLPCRFEHRSASTSSIAIRYALTGSAIPVGIFSHLLAEKEHGIVH
jgi:hypothetical protein